MIRPVYAACECVCACVCVRVFCLVWLVWVSRMLCQDCSEFFCFAGGLLPRLMVTANSSYVFVAFKKIDITNQDGGLVSTRYSYRTTILSTPHVSPVSPPCLDTFLWTKLYMFVHMMRSCSHSVNSEPPSYSSFFVGVYVCRFFVV